MNLTKDTQVGKITIFAMEPFVAENGDGTARTYVVRYEHLREDYQIGLQNAEKWEYWQDRALKSEAALKTQKDLENIAREMNHELTEAHALSELYENALIKIQGKADSINWAKEIASDVLNNEEE